MTAGDETRARPADGSVFRIHEYVIFPNFGFKVHSPHLGPSKGLFAIVTTRGPGGGGRGSVGAEA
jgi:hypothetical protein